MCTHSWYRHGDPISPYLFLIAAEGLSCLLKTSSQSTSLEGIKVAPIAPVVNHLLFADDNLLLFKSSVEAAVTVSNLLDIYWKASGQRINNEKSSIYFSKGCPQEMRDNIKQNLNMHNESLSDRYLGMPTDVGQSKMGTFKYLRDKVWRKLQGGWRNYCLQQERRYLSSQWPKPSQFTLWPVSGYPEVCVRISP